MKRIFLVSLPRAGSTVTQAVLSGHPGVSTCAEPWTQLFKASLSKKSGLVKASFNWGWGLNALSDHSLPQGKGELLEGFQNALESLEEEFIRSCCSDQTEWFLDKTPRYYLILPWLFERYPDARFIILERNLMSVLQSIYKTWCSEEFAKRILRYRVDLFDGPRLLREFLEIFGNTDRVYRVSNEDLLRHPSDTFRALFEWLSLGYQEDFLNYRNNTSFRGSFGDQTRVSEGVLAPNALTRRTIKEAFSDDPRACSFANGYARYLRCSEIQHPYPLLWDEGKPSALFDGVLATWKLENWKHPGIRGMTGLARLFCALSAEQRNAKARKPRAEHVQ